MFMIHSNQAILMAYSDLKQERMSNNLQNIHQIMKFEKEKIIYPKKSDCSENFMEIMQWPVIEIVK